MASAHGLEPPARDYPRTMKCVTICLVTVLALWAGQADETEPRKVYQAMVDKITAAKALKVSIEVQGTPFGQSKTADPKFKQTLWIDAGNKVRWAFEQPIKDKVDKDGLAVCDGKKLFFQSSAAKLNRDAADDFATRLTETFAKFGYWVSVAYLNDALDPEGKPFRGMVASTFRLGKKEKLDGREVQAIQYAVRDKGGPVSEVGVCTLWIDIKSQLPVKLLLEGPNSFRVQETYVDWQLDPKLDAKLFSAPK
jgi:outer membrane lipoprotein-sorting protein